MLKHIAKALVDSLDKYGVRVKDIPEDQFGEVYRAWWGYFWEPNKDGQPVGPKSKLFMEMLIGILERKASNA
jgi:Iap family predicted aminopeptidase